ncbi:MAG: hypothetical protein ABEJ87_04465 [Candidatus Nanohalobium sp.]
MNREKIDIDRGDNDIVFVRPELDMEDVSEKEDPRNFLEEKMKQEGLEWENARIIGLFQDEFTLMLDTKGKVLLDGEEVYSH